MTATRTIRPRLQPTRSVTHPEAGELVFETLLLAADGGDLQVVALEPADDEGRER